MTSRHSSEGGRRGVAPWIIVTAVAVLVIAVGTTAYLLIVDDDEKAGSACASQVELSVVAAPGVVDAITAAATTFDATNPVARSACVSTTVSALPNAETVTGLTTGWPQGTTPAPGMWVADSAGDLAALESANSALTAGRDTKPMASSPVVIAVRADDAAAVTAAGLSWATLPAATGPNGSVILPSGEHLVLALPDPRTNRGTSDALQSVVAARNGGTVDAAGVSAAAADLAALGATPPAAQPATTQEALTQLAAGTSAFTAVPVVESDLLAFTATTPGLTGISPSGAAVGDTVYAVGLTAPWVNPTLEDAAALFLAYLRGPGGDQAFTDNGFVVAGEPAGATAGSADATGSAPPGSVAPVDVLPDAGPAVAAALAAAIGAAPAG